MTESYGGKFAIHKGKLKLKLGGIYTIYFFLKVYLSFVIFQIRMIGNNSCPGTWFSAYLDNCFESSFGESYSFNLLQ